MDIKANGLKINILRIIIKHNYKFTNLYNFAVMNILIRINIFNHQRVHVREEKFIKTNLPGYQL